jgi:hypothetical protein
MYRWRTLQCTDGELDDIHFAIVKNYDAGIVKLYTSWQSGIIKHYITWKLRQDGGVERLNCDVLRYRNLKECNFLRLGIRFFKVMGLVNPN